MFRKDRYLFNLSAAIVFGFCAGISVGFWFSANVFIMLLIAAIAGLVSGLMYFSYLLFKT